MTDGKVCNAVTHMKSVQVWYVCGATSNIRNSTDKITWETDKSTFRFGLSILNGWIRYLECLLHLVVFWI